METPVVVEQSKPVSSVQGKPIHTIVTHDQKRMKHLSDIGAQWAAKTMPTAELLFPGITAAPIRYMSEEELAGRTDVELIGAGFFPIGIAGGKESRTN